MLCYLLKIDLLEVRHNLQSMFIVRYESAKIFSYYYIFFINLHSMFCFFQVWKYYFFLLENAVTFQSPLKKNIELRRILNKNSISTHARELQSADTRLIMLFYKHLQLLLFFYVGNISPRAFDFSY